MKRIQVKTAEDYIQERENLKAMISLCKKGLAIVALVFIAFVAGTMAGCATTGNTVTVPPEARVMDDMGNYDDYIIDLCTEQTKEVLTNLVMSEPTADWPQPKLLEIYQYLYGNCIRDNGRSL